jgi:hypothetical protein
MAGARVGAEKIVAVDRVDDVSMHSVWYPAGSRSGVETREALGLDVSRRMQPPSSSSTRRLADAGARISASRSRPSHATRTGCTIRRSSSRLRSTRAPAASGTCSIGAPSARRAAMRLSDGVRTLRPPESV